VLGALVAAGPYVPLLIALEAAWMGIDVFVVRALLGQRAREVPWPVYARSAISVYPVTILFPAGRASAEATRAALLAPYLGAPTTALAAIRVQGAGLLGTTLISLVALAVIAATLGFAHRLAAAVALSALLMAILGALLLFGTRRPRALALLRRFLPATAAALVTAEPTSRPFTAVTLSFLGRAVQAVLFAVALLATTGALSLRRGLVAQSIAVAGATVGDVVPQQAGVLEGAFTYFAGAIGLDARPDRALATVLLIRACQIALTAMALLVTLVLRWSGSRKGVQSRA
jgi:uncharacterized membrane protein YbhN (UPF0104 family)